VAICCAHALKPKLGLAPLYLMFGLFEAFIFVTGKAYPAITAELFFVDPVNLSFTLFLPLLLSTIFIVYVLEGTVETRRLIVAVILLYIVHGAIDFILEYHAVHPAAGEPYEGDVVWFSTHTRVAALVAMVTDFIVLIVVYQFLSNRLGSLPLFIPFLAALAVAIVNDGMFFGIVRYGSMALDKMFLPEKLQAGIAAAIPTAAYLAFQMHRNRDQVEGGVLQRGALEIIGLQRRVDEIQAELKEQKAQYLYIKETFSRYVSPEVVDAIIKDPTKVELGGEVRFVTILFADIRGYSTLSEALEPTEIIDLLNVYFRRVSKVILKNRGMINEFEGDAVLAVFGAPLDLTDHASLAVSTGLGMLRAVEELNVEWEKNGIRDKFREVGLDDLAIRIGIHTGRIVAGNIGSEEHLKYAVIGDTVNLTSRVEGLNKITGTSILITAATLEALGDASDQLIVEDRGRHQVKGRRESVQVYSVSNKA
jgi:class 3 adenylate cyclase